jgi:acetyltransferase-like isoleucine patch superfamily enzyme
MVTSNIHLGSNVTIDSTTTINNVDIGNEVKIAKYCSVYGSKANLLEIGAFSYIGMFSILNGYSRKIKIGQYVSIAQNVNMMTDSGPNASSMMQQFYPLIKGEIIIEDHVWIGAGVIIMPGVHIGRCSVIAANSFVNTNVEAYSLYAGNPAQLVKSLDVIKSYENKAV